jgi:hypothetical protein
MTRLQFLSLFLVPFLPKKEEPKIPDAKWTRHDIVIMGGNRNHYFWPYEGPPPIPSGPNDDLFWSVPEKYKGNKPFLPRLRFKQGITLP